jgi:hypothetical protein
LPIDHYPFTIDPGTEFAALTSRYTEKLNKEQEPEVCDARLNDKSGRQRVADKDPTAGYQKHPLKIN